MYSFSCVLWASQIARYLPHHRSENASKTHPKSSHDKFKTASKKTIEFRKRPYSQLGKMRNSLKTNILIYVLMKLVRSVGFDFF